MYAFILKQTVKEGTQLTSYPVVIPKKLYMNQPENLQEAQQTLRELGFTFGKFARSYQDFSMEDFESKVLEVWSKEDETA